MRLQHVLFLLALSLTLPGCAMREPLTPAVSEPEAVPLAVSFTEQVATFPEGATQYFAESPFGPVTIERERSIFLVWATNVVRPALRVEAQVKDSRYAERKTAHGVSFPLFLRVCRDEYRHDSSIIGVVSTDCSRKSDLRPRSA